jgi:phage/plasmid primase-like uncharacterized protein
VTIPADLTQRARSASIETEIARRGIRLRRSGKELIGPCPRCGGTDRFSCNPGKGVWHCRQCKPADISGDVIGLVMWLDGIEFLEAVELLTDETVPRRPATAFTQGKRTDDPDRTRSIALRLWNEAGLIEGSAGQCYFERSRKIFELPPDVHEVLRFHPRVIFGRDGAGNPIYRACVLALFRDILTNEPTGIHRIAVTADGKPHHIVGPKGELIQRMALGRKQGTAVKLWGDDRVTTGLSVGEGIETTLAAATQIIHRGTLLQPAWSLIDATNLKAFPPLPGIEYLTIFSDNDEAKRRPDGTLWCPGPDAAKACAKRWAAAGVDAEVLTPDRRGSDFNDLTRQTRAGQP